MLFEITLLGVRGSLPTPYPPKFLSDRIVNLCRAFSFGQKKDVDEFFASIPHQLKGGYGGNTTCVQVRTAQTQLIIDAGTGIRHAIPYYMQKGAPKDIHLFFTHFHWDHIIGLPFFTPIYIPGNTIHFYAVQHDLERVIRTLFQKPFFPVPFEALGAKIVFHLLKPREKYKIHDLEITPYLLDHPDPCWGLKVHHQGKNYAHCVDSEATRISREELGEDLPLYQDIDLMVFDAQYSFQEAQEKINWGHASAPKGLELASREKIKKMIFVHHDPFATDEQVALTAREAVRFFEHFQENHQNHQNPQDVHYVEWDVGYEGMMIKLI